VLYILLGQDDFSRRQVLEEIKRGMGDQTLLATNTTTLDGHQLSLDQLKTTCETAPFLAEKRLVIVNGLLVRFEPKNKSRQRVKTAANDYKSFAAYIPTIPESTTLVLVDGRLKSGNSLLRELSTKAKVKNFPLLRNEALRQWIKQQVKQEGASISPEAVNLLAKLIGGNLWTMANEISKLALFTLGRRIEAADVKGLVSFSQEANVFAMVDAILESRVGVAEQSLGRLLESGAASAYLLVMLSRQVRMIVLAKEMMGQRKSEAEIQDGLGLTSEFALRKVLGQAGRYPMGQIMDIYRKLLETDLAIKTGKYNGELALNLLVAELCQRR